MGGGRTSANVAIAVEAEAEARPEGGGTPWKAPKDDAMLLDPRREVFVVCQDEVSAGGDEQDPVVGWPAREKHDRSMLAGTTYFERQKTVS